MACSDSVVIPVLQGPCRRSPFDDAGSGGFCGEDSDWIVANNLMERVALESLQAMAAFRDALERASGLEGRIEASRLEEMKLLLSPFFRGPSALLKAIYPERAFPSLHALGFPQGSWMTERSWTRPPAPARKAGPRSDPDGRPSPLGDGPCGGGPVAGAGRFGAGGDRSSPARLPVSPSAAHFRMRAVFRMTAGRPLDE